MFFKNVLCLGAKLSVMFDHEAPSLALGNAFGPSNAQNTLFLYDGFWALLLPVTVGMHVADIWRGYFAQRLLWDIGGDFVYTPSSVYQNTDHRRCEGNFSDEEDLYNKSGDLVKLLSNWKYLSLLVRNFPAKRYWTKVDL